MNETLQCGIYNANTPDLQHYLDKDVLKDTKIV